MRQTVLSSITAAISTLTQFSVSQELPWSQNGQPLFLKNMKKIYVDRESVEESINIALLNANDIMDQGYTLAVYLAVDAKNTPSQLDLAINKILGAKSGLASGYFGQESDYSLDKQEDVLVYTFEFRATQIQT